MSPDLEHDLLRGVDVADAVLEPDDLGVSGEPAHRRRGEGGIGPVVDDDRQLAGLGDGLEVADQSLGRSADQVRRQHQQPVRSGVGWRPGRRRRHGASGPPAPPNTGDRPPVAVTDVCTTVATSPSYSAWNSPVPQAANTAPGRWSSRDAMCSLSRPVSTAPAVSNGVTGKNSTPSSCRMGATLVGHDASVSSMSTAWSVLSSVRQLRDGRQPSSEAALAIENAGACAGQSGGQLLGAGEELRDQLGQRLGGQGVGGARRRTSAPFASSGAPASQVSTKSAASRASM